MAPTLLMITIVPVAVALKIVGYNSLLNKLRVHHDELIANLANKAKIILYEGGIINRLEMITSKRKKTVNFFLPMNFNPKMQAI